MRTSLHILLCLTAAFLVIGAAHLLDLWVFAGAVRSNASMDGSYAWATALSRVVLAFLLLVLSGIVLYRPPSPLVGLICLLGGAIPSLAFPLGLSAVSFLPGLPLPVGDSGANLYFAFAFVGVLGVAAFVRPHLPPWPAPPNQSLQRTAGTIQRF